ncbi:CDP-alcohol phosphatidyltransferase family protein [Micromonospora sp. CA-263727]|uniref:CDP-alcohol phosphatidyltransferase family protein n=1 Tax=Micromonospora sp. CA-263727 TaxID=3239967 RepID=UPI003D94932D
MRRSGTLARQVLLVRVGRRGAELHGSTETLPEPRYPDRPRRRYGLQRFNRARIETIAPVSPAVAPAPVTDQLALATDQPTPVTVRPALVADEPATAPVPLLPGERTMARRMKFALVNACTLASLLLGINAIFVAMRGDVRLAALLLIACVAFDGLDGALARKLGVASPFGAQMDSLADMCSFGLAAPVVVYASLAGEVPTAAAGVAAALVAACAAIRLARFNVSPQDGRFFSGVPTTMAAAVLALMVVIGLPVPGAVQIAGVALLAFTMVSSFPYAKLARLVRLPAWVWLAPVVGALIDVRLTFGLIVVGYLISGPVLWLRQRRTI